MSIASMSERIMQQGSRMHYRCSKCAEKSAGEPGSRNLSLRILRLYALVGTGGGVHALALAADAPGCVRTS